MNQIKKFLCCLMVLCMIVTVLPITVHAADDTGSTGTTDGTPGATEAPAPEDDEKDVEDDVPPATEAPKPDVIVSGTCGQEADWVLNETKGTLTISGTGIVYNYSAENPAPWNKYAAKITGITVAEGITRLGNYAFAGCTKLTNVALPKTLTNIGSYAFLNCAALAEIALPEALEGIAIHMFEGCTSLKTVAIPKNVLTIGIGAFTNCTGLTEITIPRNVTEIGNNAFSGCSKLATVTLNAAILEIADNTFYDCAALTAIAIPEGVKTIGARAFYNCASLASATFPKTLTAIGDSAFAMCGKLATLNFAGTAPAIADDAFYKVTALAYYPMGDKTWTEEKLDNYGGTLTWHPCCVGEHKFELTGKKEPNCTDKGYTGDTACSVCGIVSAKGEEIPALGHDFTNVKPIHNAGKKTHSYACNKCDGQKDEDCTYGEGKIILEATMAQAGIKQFTCTECGGTYNLEYTLESTIERIYGKNRYETAFAIADAMKANLGVSKFDAVIVASGTQFADALSGSYLAAVKNAPILISSGSNDADIKEYIKANVKTGSTVYLLGGTAALPASMEKGLEGYTVTRLSGKTRYETNLAILEEAGVGTKDILVCTGTSFADSLSASAANRPILLVSGSLTDGQKAFLDGLSGNKIYIIGGSAAVSETVKKALEAYGTVERISGKDRYETSVLVAHNFVKGPEAAVLAYGRNFPDGLCGGPLAVSMGAPLILTENGSESAAQKYVQGYKLTNGVVLGGKSLISEATVEKIFN